VCQRIYLCFGLFVIIKTFDESSAKKQKKKRKKKRQKKRKQQNDIRMNSLTPTAKN